MNQGPTENKLNSNQIGQWFTEPCALMNCCFHLSLAIKWISTLSQYESHPLTVICVDVSHCPAMVMSGAQYSTQGNSSSCWCLTCRKRHNYYCTCLKICPLFASDSGSFDRVILPVLLASGSSLLLKEQRRVCDQRLYIVRKDGRSRDFTLLLPLLSIHPGRLFCYVASLSPLCR